MILSFWASTPFSLLISCWCSCSNYSSLWLATILSSLSLASTRLSSFEFNFSNCCLHFSIYLFICSFSATDCSRYLVNSLRSKSYSLYFYYYIQIIKASHITFSVKCWRNITLPAYRPTANQCNEHRSWLCHVQTQHVKI